MKQSLLAIVGLALVSCPSVSARTLTPAEALARVAGQNGELRSSRSGNAAASLEMTIGSPSEPAMYLFSKQQGGYMVVSADDVAAPLLGYSDSGEIDPANMPPALQYWLECYRQQIERASQSDVSDYAATPREERAPVGPLMATTWDQGAPYYNDCPKLNGRSCYTGCVATAMAQVMKYHEWPAKVSSNANLSYYWNEGKATISKDYSDHEFDWANMLDSYRNGYTTAEGNAVADLMAACGYSVRMGYTPSGSGAGTLLISNALTEYFDYDKGIYTTKRFYYSLSEWEDLVYNNLQNCGPVIYVGFNDHSGHCFVCDGYSSDGYFHFNWGWSGSSDGYFLLTALEPSKQGIGGSTDGYDSHQNIILGIRPNSGSERRWQFICNENFSMSATSGVNGNIVASRSFTNYSSANAEGHYGLRLVSETDGETIALVQETISGYRTAVPESGLNSFSIKKSRFPEGTYRAYPVFIHSDGTVSDVVCKNDETDYYLISKKGNDFTLERPTLGEYKVTDLRVVIGFYGGKKDFYVTGNAVWSGTKGVNRTLYGALYENGTLIAIAECMPQEFPANGEPRHFDYKSYWLKIKNSTYAKDGIPEGNYHFAMVTEDRGVYTPVSEIIPITMKADPGDLKLEVVSHSVDDADCVNPNDIRVNFKLKCTQGMLADNIMVRVFGGTPGRGYIGGFYSEPIYINEGGEYQGTATGTLDAIPGEKAFVYLSYKDTSRNISGSRGHEIYFAVTTGIGDVIVDGAGKITASPNPAEDYTVISASADIVRVDLVSVGGQMTGVTVEIDGTTARVDVSRLASGLYVARVVTATGVEAVKIVKK